MGSNNTITAATNYDFHCRILTIFSKILVLAIKT